MKDRINEFILLRNLTPAEFADMIGVQRSSVSHVLNGRNNPSFSFIQKMMETFPTINARWLLLGEGNIYGQKNENEYMLDEQEQKENGLDLFSSFNDIKENSHYEKQANVPTAPAKELSAMDNRPLENSTKNSKGKTVKKVLIFYSDHTFEEYGPTD